MAVSAEIVFGVFAMLSYGLADFLAKKAVDKYGPFAALKISLVSGTSLVFLYSLLFVGPPAATAGTVVFVLLAGIAGAAGWLYFYRGLKHGQVSIVSPIASSWGVVPFVLAIAVLSEGLTIAQILLSVSIFAGIFLVSVNWEEFVAASKKKLYAGAGMALLAMLGFGLSGFLTKFVVDELGVFYTVVLIRAVSIFLIFAYAGKSGQKAKFEPKFIWLLVVVGVLDAIGYLSFNFGISSGLVSIVSAITSAAPLVVIVLAYLFLKERLATNQYIGILLIMLGFAGLSVL